MFTTARLYTALYAHRIAEGSKTAAKAAKTYTSDHKSEIQVGAATAAVVGVTARVAGFKAGYAYATNQTPLV